jgi:hypothetical protein
MGITFSKRSNRRRLVEPLFVKTRQKFRGSRSSLSENNEINSLIVDMERLKIELDSIEVSIAQNSVNLVGYLNTLTEVEKINDEPLYDITGVEVHYDGKTSGVEQLSLRNLNDLSAKLSSLESRIRFMEDIK